MTNTEKSLPHLQPEKKENTDQKEKSFGKWFKEVFLVFLLAVVVALCIKTFLVDTRVVPSSSMYPTIEVGDRVLVNRLFRILGKEPQRGDIVVFKAPEEMDENSDLIKRVIGLPGDSILIREGQLYINDVPLEEEYLNEAPAYDYGPVTVPENCYFMLGDNRNRSIDGHLWKEPFIPFEDIKGEAFCRYWPLDRIGELD
ncbi:MAG: signal peptidase I [Bacillota bacterium]|nr:signal peptidase I [Bacillota bacterium]